MEKGKEKMEKKKLRERCIKGFPEEVR